MANFRSIYKVQLFLTILIHLTLALYEDQVGKFDWKRSFIGKVKFVSLEAKRLIVATEENVLASLNLNSGEIQWRQVLEDPQYYQIELVQLNKEVLVVSGGGNSWLVRTWDVNNGALLNEWAITSDRVVPNAFTQADDKLYHIVPILGSHLEITSYQLDTNSKLFEKRIDAAWMRDIKDCVTTHSYFVCLTNNQLYYVNLAVEDSFTIATIGEVFAEPNNPFLIDFNSDIPAVLVSQDNTAKLVQLDNFLVKNYELLPNAQRINDAIYQLEADKNMLVQVTAKDSTTGKTLLEVDLNYPVGLGAPIILSGETRGPITDLLVTTTDNALMLIRLPEGRIQWTREEALSNILATEFIELPVSALDASIEHEFDNDGSVFGMFIHRITTQFLQLYSLLFDHKLDQSNGLVRDEFGLHKIVVVATKAGKLFGIDTLSGSIAWSYRLPNIQPFLGFNGKEMMKLIVLRTAQYAPLNAQCALLAQDSMTLKGVYFQFDPISGFSTDGIKRLEFPIKQVVVLPAVSSTNLKQVVLIADDLSLHPKGLDVDNQFVYIANPSTSTLNGFKLMRDQLVPVWVVQLQPGRLVAVEAKPSNERVHSQGKVLYDRSVYYKYVNPNLLAVATISQDQIHHNVVSIYLIDGVTGLVVHSVSHKRAKGPIHLVHSENWLVYSYFNERFRRTELAALELYEGHLQTNKTTFSSFAASHLPDVQTQSYILPANPVEMTVTITERGITNKFLLIALTSGAVIEIPWLLLQPRFLGMPCGPEESCLPYMPEIPLHSEAIINYNQTLNRIRGIEVAPARLESTSHILIHGLDMFYTRVAPSKTFDVLKEDFDHILIVLVLSALVVASFITKHLAARKALKQAWK